MFAGIRGYFKNIRDELNTMTDQQEVTDLTEWFVLCMGTSNPRFREY